MSVVKNEKRRACVICAGVSNLPIVNIRYELSIVDRRW
jgi:hypothetical protein